MKRLFMLTAALEAGAGLGLIVCPSEVAVLLVGSSLDTAAILIVARVAGIALSTLGIICWLARNDDQSRAANGIVAGMLFYNTAVASILAYAGFGLGLRAVALWPAVVIHAAMAIWCMTTLINRK